MPDGNMSPCSSARREQGGSAGGPKAVRSNVVEPLSIRAWI